MQLSFGIHTFEVVALAFLILVAASDRIGGPTHTTAFTSIPLTFRGSPRNVVTSQPRSIRMKSAPLWAKTVNSYRPSLPVMEVEITKKAEIHGNKVTAERTSSTLERKSTDPTPVLFSLVQKMTKEPAIYVVAVALSMVLMLSPASAAAAMSGDSFPSQRSSLSRSMRSQSSLSYGGGYSRGSSYSRGFQYALQFFRYASSTHVSSGLTR